MYAKELVNNNIPALQPSDTVSKALLLMSDFRLKSLPLVNDGKFEGLVEEEDMLDLLNDQQKLGTLKMNHARVSVKNTDHFLNAVYIMTQHESQVVAVIDDQNNYHGAIIREDLFITLGEYAGAAEPGGIVILEMERIHYSISEISRLAESNDITILHLNTSTNTESGRFRVTLHLNKRELASLVATYERYDYHVLYFTGKQSHENEIESNYHNLMNYLEL